MDHSPHAAAVRRRAVLLLIVATVALTGVSALAGPPVRHLVDAQARADFTQLLVASCSLAALVAAVGLWALTAAVVVGVLRAPLRPGHAGVGPLRGVLLAACGVAALGSTAPATAASGNGGDPVAPPLVAAELAGLPLPDRATGAAADHVVTVRPGDSLWRIAAGCLGPRATVADVASYWPRVHARNRGVVGPDPDLLHPGQRLRLPPP